MMGFDNGEMAAGYNKCLAIIVPYRDRAEHLGKFVPHLATYFQRDKLDRHIAFSLHVVEQSGTAIFNRGRLRNCGYALARDGADYVCFHDVDYLPLWADYSWSARPARLAWHGLTLPEDPEFFSAPWFCSIRPRSSMSTAIRTLLGMGLRRRGTGPPLPSGGTWFRQKRRYLSGAGASACRLHRSRRAHRRGRADGCGFLQRRSRLAEFMYCDGLSNLKFELLEKRPIMVDGQVLPHSFHYLVDIGQPKPDESVLAVAIGRRGGAKNLRLPKLARSRSGSNPATSCGTPFSTALV